MIDEAQDWFRDPVTHLVLASTSPRRAQLLQCLGIPFNVRSLQVTEDNLTGESPVATVERLALAKAGAVTWLLAALREPSTPSQLVLGADTMVVDDHGAVGKPRSRTDAVSLLSRLRGRKHLVTTGVALIDLVSGATSVRSVTTVVQMRGMSDDEIEGYVATGDPLDKAGGYAIQNRVFKSVASIEGCYSNVVGLPLCVVSEMLRDRGVEVDRPRMTEAGRCTCARLADWIN